MRRIGLVFFSGSGTTRKLTVSVVESINAAGAQLVVCEVNGSDIVEGRWSNEELASALDDCDGIIFGTPTYMGGVSAQLKSFMDAMAPRWFTQTWNGKLAAAYTVSSLEAGDKLNALQDISTFAMQMGMIWVGTGASFSDGMNANGFYLGAGATASTPDQLKEIDVKTAGFLASRVVEFADRLSG